MKHVAKAMRPFVGARNFDLSRQFYLDLGFRESRISHNMTLFVADRAAFYLQDAYVKDWVDNTMVFMEVEDVPRYYEEIKALGLVLKYPGVRLSTVQENDWGREIFLHDPSGVLWHIGEFYNPPKD